MSPGRLEPRHFELAHRVLVEAGWNPCAHPDHNTDCRAVAQAIADAEQRGRRFAAEEEIRSWAMG